MSILSFLGFANRPTAKSKLRGREQQRARVKRRSMQRRSLLGEFLEPRIALAVAPIAAPDAGDSGTIIGFNAPLSVPAASGLLANDSDPDLGDVITFHFQGKIDSTDADFTTGDTFVGTYSFRASTADVGHPDPTLNTQYWNPNSNDSFEIYFPTKGYRFTGTSVTISVGNNTTFGDRYIVSMGNPVNVGTPLPSGRTIGFAQFDIQDPVASGQNFLTNDSIQTRSPDLSLASNAGGRLVMRNNDHTFLTLDQLDGPLQVTAVNGNAAAVGQTITLPSGASLTVRSNGAYTYDPSVAFAYLPTGAVAADSFTYRVTDASFISGGDGQDTLTGGSADDVIFGGVGDDTITGAAGHDLLVGGAGKDRIVGSSGNDILVAGDLECGLNLDALREISAAWATSRGTQAESGADLLDEAVGDADSDQLTGSAGADLFIISTGDKITDFQFGKPKTNKDGDVVIKDGVATT